VGVGVVWVIAGCGCGCGCGCVGVDVGFIVFGVYSSRSMCEQEYVCLWGCGLS
jgi:hypothetical protein